MSALQLSQVSKVYGSGASEVHALHRGGPDRRSRRAGRGHGTERLRQEHIADDRRQSRRALRRRGHRWRRAAVAAVAQRAGRAASPRDRLRLPGLQPARRADRGRERVAASRVGRHIWRKAARAAALEALDRLGLAERADRFPDELSGGERQRVAIARAVVGERHLLLADEPSGALDSVNGEAVMRLVRETCQGGVAGVVVTHDAQLASWADRVVFLRDGRIVDQTARADGPESLLDADPAR